MRVSLWFLLSLSLVAPLQWASANENIPIDNFAEVSPGIYRGGAPSDAGTAYLASLGVKTDIDLESFRWPVIWDEEHDGNRFGIELVNEPLFSFPGILHYIQPPITDERIDEILGLLSNDTGQPVFVHCKKGMDRTGLVVGLYRVLIEKWEPAQAWAEMLKFGYHPSFKALTRYFEQRANWKSPSNTR
jgi:protein tyrosine/serine phosphatase